MNNLLGKSEVFDPSSLPHDSIILAHDLTPSMTARLDRNQVQAFATEVGSRTSHTAILARSLAIPAVVGLHDITSAIPNGATALLDGYNGYLIIRIRRSLNMANSKNDQLVRPLSGHSEQPAVTKDGFEVHLGAIWKDPKMFRASSSGAELLFLNRISVFNRDSSPQKRNSSKLTKSWPPNCHRHGHHSNTGHRWRQIDLTYGSPRGTKPFLGWRAIRYCLQEEHRLEPAEGYSSRFRLWRNQNDVPMIQDMKNSESQRHSRKLQARSLEKRHCLRFQSGRRRDDRGSSADDRRSAKKLNSSVLERTTSSNIRWHRPDERTRSPPLPTVPSGHLQ